MKFGVWFVLMSPFCFAIEVPVTEDTPLHSTASHFLTTVQFAVEEKNPALLLRDERLVMEELGGAIRSWPEFANRRFEMLARDGEVIFSVTTAHDVREPMQRAVAMLLKSIDGKVRGKGRTQFYRTGFEEQATGLLKVRTDSAHRKILSVTAQSVPLRRVLKEIKAQLGRKKTTGFSYLMPAGCAEQSVDWSFGEEGKTAKTLDDVMEEVGALLGLELNKTKETYVFKGVCRENGAGAELETAEDFFIEVPTTVTARSGLQPRAVFYPMPLVR